MNNTLIDKEENHMDMNEAEALDRLHKRLVRIHKRYAKTIDKLQKRERQECDRTYDKYYKERGRPAGE